MKPIIQISELSKKYISADFFSVNKLNLTIYEGQIFGLLGPNGAGKTTLISLLCGLLKPSNGEIEIQGLKYAKQANQIKKIIGVVPQEYALYPTLTAKENLRYFGSMYGLQGKYLNNKIDENLEYLGLLSFADKKIETFSGGMKRRVNLIAGILHEPKILFLDEPTVGVDVQSKNAIINYLQKSNLKGTTIIYTSHHLTEAQEFCTEIAIIDKGKIYMQGTPENLINSVPDAHNLEDVFLSITGNNLRDGL